jgi:Ca2+-transporting ATPase
MTVSKLMIGVQTLIVLAGGEAFPAVPPTGVRWAVSVVLGFLVLPAGMLVRYLPNSLFEKAVGATLALYRRNRRNRAANRVPTG